MSETQHIENYLQHQLNPEDRLLMDTRLILDNSLHEKVIWQQRTYELVQAYGRQSIRRDIERAHQRVFTEKQYSSFRQLIHNIFK